MSTKFNIHQSAFCVDFFDAEMKTPETSLQALSSFPLPPTTPKRACSQASSVAVCCVDHSNFILSCNLIGQRENKSARVRRLFFSAERSDSRLQCSQANLDDSYPISVGLYQASGRFVPWSTIIRKKHFENQAKYPGEGGELPIMAYTGRLRPKGVG